MNYPRIALAAVAALLVFFAWGFLIEGWLIRKDFAPSASIYRTSDLQMKYMPLGMAAFFAALFAAGMLYAKWCGAESGAMTGLQFGVLMGVFAACTHPLSNLVTMNIHLKLGLETTASAFFGWLLAGIAMGLVYKPVIAAAH